MQHDLQSVRLRWTQSREVLEVYPRRLALPLSDALDQTDAAFGVQFGKHLCRLFALAVKDFHRFFYGIVDVDVAFFVQPAVFNGQAHAVEHSAIEELCVGGDGSQPLIGRQQLWDAVEGKFVGLMAAEVGQG